jgi:DNA polymerase/3'-5' exonuclease PolX
MTMKFDRAKHIADAYLNKLKPFCARIEIAGSIRRERRETDDIILVCIPKTISVNNGIFDSYETRDKGFIETINSLRRSKGGGEGNYVQVLLPELPNLDLVITTPEQWGVVFMMMTGSEMFSRRMAASVRPYFICDKGYLKKNSGAIIPCYEETDFFRFTGMEYVEPFARVV